MRNLSFSVFAILGGLAFAQDPSDSFDKAPQAIDDALRARVDAFYQAHVDGKFRVADQYVAEDSKDAFFAAEKTKYKAFNIMKISYTDNFTKASVMTGVKTDVFFHGEKFPVTMPVVTRWKVENEQWWWYYTQSTEMESPFGTFKPGPDGAAGLGPVIPKDFNQAGKDILSKVSMDGLEVTIDQDRSSKQELHLKNALLGTISVFTDPTGMPGLTVTPEKGEVGPGEQTAIVIAFDIDDPTIRCRDCLIHPGVLPPVVVRVHVKPTMHEFPIKITFTQHGAGK